MIEKELLQLIRKHDWKKFLTRPYDLFFVSIHAHTYHAELKKILGLNCKHSLYIGQNGMVDIYHDVESSREIHRTMHELLNNDRPKLEKFLEEIKSAEQKIKNIINESKNDNFQINIFSIDYYLKLYTKSFAYLTAIPFNLGSAIVENKLEQRDEIFSRILCESKKLRSVNYYQNLEKYILEPAFLNLTKKHNLSSDIFRHLTLHEIEKLIDQKYTISKQKLEQRKKEFVYLASENDRHLFYGNGLSPQLNKILALPSSSEKNIKGQTAYPGKVRGQIKIVLRPDDIKKFKEGNILVGVSTNPDLMPILCKAGAIVTDEGGLLSHAAILARELKIPCIIGTGNATKILKDGDFIEVDAEKGEIRYCLKPKI